MPARSSISFLVHDVSAPTIGVAVRFGGLLKDAGFEVQVVGPDLGHGVCSMYREAFAFTVVPCPRIYRFPDFFREVRRLEAAVRGDVVIALKAFADTVPVALRLKRGRGAKAVVYLDEWDGAQMRELSWPGRLSAWLQHVHHPLNHVYFPWIERRIREADLVISSSTFLQKKFGGRLVPMGVDPDFFKPQAPGRRAALRKELGLENCRVLGFGGVVRPHKGLEIMLDAVRTLKDPRVKVLVMGPLTEPLAALMADRRYATLLQCAGDRPGPDSKVNAEVHRRMPEYLDAADVLLVPLGDSLLARSQVPCKVFEAMAMAKPILATAVSDLPAILDGCGWVVPPGEVGAAAAALQDIFDHPAEAEKRGRAAREKCLTLYSREATQRGLVSAISDVV